MRKVVSCVLCLAVLLTAAPTVSAAEEASEPMTDEEAAMIKIYDELRRKLDNLEGEEATFAPNPDRSDWEIPAEVQAIQLSQDIPQFRYMTFSQEPIGMSGRWLIVPENTYIYPAEGYELAAWCRGYRVPPGHDMHFPGYQYYEVCTSDGTQGMDFSVYAYPADSGLDWRKWTILTNELGVEHVMVMSIDNWNFFAFQRAAMEAGTARTTRWNLVSDWALEAVEAATDMGLTPPAMKFSDDLRADMERQQFAAVAVRLWERLKGSAAPAEPEHPFEDIADFDPHLLDVFDELWDTWDDDERWSWQHKNYIYSNATNPPDPYAQACAQAYALGLIFGISGTEFAPQDTLTREQAATILYRLVAEEEGDPDAAASLTFDDAGEISGWAREAVAFLTSRGIISGVGGNRFAPKAPVTCQEALALAVRIANEW